MPVAPTVTLGTILLRLAGCSRWADKRGAAGRLGLPAHIQNLTRLADRCVGCCALNTMRLLRLSLLLLSGL